MTAANRTVLLGLDGATFTVLDPLMRDGIMPFLAEFVSTGVRGELQSVIPALTPPAWTSLTTGRSPGHHGIFDFFCKESPESHHIRIATARDVHVETIWDLADRHGLRTTALNFPLMFPPPRVRGCVVPGWMPWRQLRLGCHPPELYDRLRKLDGFDAKELAMDITPDAKPVQGVRPEEYEEWVVHHIGRERQWASILRTLMQEEPADLTAIVFDGVDRIQHLCWRYISPPSGERLSPEGERIRQRCLQYFRELDRLLAGVVARAGSEATVVLASDHGFGPQTGTFFANAWLEQRGYLAWADRDVPRASEPEALGIAQLARHAYLLDWEKTRAYAPTPSSNGVHIVRRGPGHPHGVAASEYEAFREKLAGELREAIDPATGRRIVAKVHTREEVFAGPYESLAPDLTLELADGGLVSILASDKAFMSRAETSGTHRRNGVLMARGPGMARGVRLPELSILDVPPILLHALGLEIPADMEGTVPEGVFEPPWLLSRPIRRAPPARVEEEPEPAAGEPFFTEKDERELAHRLRQLGYID